MFEFFSTTFLKSTGGFAFYYSPPPPISSWYSLDSNIATLIHPQSWRRSIFSTIWYEKSTLPTEKPIHSLLRSELEMNYVDDVWQRYFMRPPQFRYYNDYIYLFISSNFRNAVYYVAYNVLVLWWMNLVFASKDDKFAEC